MKKYTDIVVTGIGIINPFGCNYQEFSAQIVKGIPSFSVQAPIPQPCGYVADGFDVKTGVSPRKMRKMDKFTQFSIVAAEQAIAHSKIEITEKNADKVGIVMGNSLGGWQFVEPQLYELYQGDMDAINSYVATAWFPTASQGEISIEFGIKGYSKTLSGGALSGSWSIHHAIDLLNSGNLETVLVGGFEAPLTPLVYNEFFETGYISQNDYLPYSKSSKGKLLGEGGAFLILEKYEHAEKRGCDPLAFISQPKFGTSYHDVYTKICDGYDIKKADYVLLDGSGDQKIENEELSAIHDLCQSSIVYSTPKTLYGDLLSGNGPTDVACGISSFQNSCIIPGQYFDENDSKYIYSPTHKKLNRILINASDNNGQCSVFCLSKNKEAHQSWQK